METRVGRNRWDPSIIEPYGATQERKLRTSRVSQVAVPACDQDPHHQYSHGGQEGHFDDCITDTFKLGPSSFSITTVKVNQSISYSWSRGKPCEVGAL